MYPPTQQPTTTKMRPRSNLSLHQREIKGKQSHSNNALLTLAGFCVFLFVLCSFLLGALIYVGRTLVDESADQMTAVAANDDKPISSEDEDLIFSKPILRIRGADAVEQANKRFKHNIMAPSKILSKLSFRLPREIRPESYRLRLHPDLGNKTFTGNIKVRFQVLQPINFIPVHSKLLNVTTEEVVRLGEDGTPLEKITPSLTFEHTGYEFWVTEFEKPLQQGNYSLHLRFKGSLVNRIVGFYASSYVSSEHKRRWIATSKFEPTYARQAFPCFDEPDMKAKFTITLVRSTGDGYHALSNMDIESENEMGNLTEVNFSESVPMSTYLACFIISDFTHQSKTVRGIVEGANDFEMRVFSTASQINKVNYALNAGVGIVEFYINYFNVQYPLPKLDMAAIPDFVSGAMEHWGLVTYRETALLYDPEISSSANKQRVATVIAHELAHMWFGNLVTMKWWNDLWLNEGFASYIEYKGVNEIHPDWQIMDQFLVEDLHSVMTYDATLASHPIVQTVENPDQITSLFDTITYAKGAAIIRMLEDMVGAEKFRSGTTSYLNKFMYKNAETNDFLTEIEAQDFDFNVKLILQTWTEQMGFPVVQVTRIGNTLKLTQKRFLSNPESNNSIPEKSYYNYRWSIPITYVTSESSDVQRLIFNYDDNEVTLPVADGIKWIKFNKNQIGYYRVNYMDDMWQELTNALIIDHKVFSPSDRAHLIVDVFALADTDIKYETALNVLKYLEKELDYVPWNVAVSRLNSMKHLLHYTDLFRNYTLFVRKLLKTVYDEVTWNVGDEHLKNLLRVSILTTACGFGNYEALDEAAERFVTWLKNPAQRPNPDLRSVIYYYGMQIAGNEEQWDQVWQLFLDEQDAQEKTKLMQSLAAINKPWILQRYINLAWNESNVRGQDYFNCLQQISQNPIGQSLVWDYVRENWERLVDRFGLNNRYLGRLIPGITGRFSTQTKLEEIEAFFAKYPEAGAGVTSRKEALETVKYNIRWLEKNKDQVGKWLAGVKQQTAGGTDNTIRK